MDIENLFSKEQTLKKFSHKRWVTIHPVNDNYQENTAIKYNCKNIQDKLVNYHDGYILLDVKIAKNNLADGDRVAPKGSHSFIKQNILRINNSEVENFSNVFLATEMLNQLEFSQDYSRNMKQYLYAQDTAGSHTAENHGHTERIKMIPDVAAHEVNNCKVKIPLMFISSFFRHLDFPLMNQLIEFEIIYRLANAILSPRANTNVTITSSTLHLPIVELSADENTKLLKAFNSKNFKKSFKWYRFTSRTHAAAANTESSHLIEPSIDGIRKLFVVPKTNFDFNQINPDIYTTIKLKNFNIVVDSEDFYPEDIRTDEEAYELISENFNMGGKDPNTGALLDFKIFKKQNSFYVFDLSRQKVFQSNPRKSQSIRFKCTPDAVCHIMYFIAQEKETTINFINPLETKTI